MFSICVFILSILTLSHAGSVVPVKTSHVDVRRSGGEFSYNIHENQGVASIAGHIPIVQPQIRAVHITEKSGSSEKHTEHHEGQTHSETDIHSKTHTEAKEGAGELTLIQQPLIPYTYYYPYTPYAIQPISKSHIVPYPYTIINTL